MSVAHIGLGLLCLIGASFFITPFILYVYKKEEYYYGIHGKQIDSDKMDKPTRYPAYAFVVFGVSGAFVLLFGVFGFTSGANAVLLLLVIIAIGCWIASTVSQTVNEIKVEVEAVAGKPKPQENVSDIRKEIAEVPTLDRMKTILALELPERIATPLAENLAAIRPRVTVGQVYFVSDLSPSLPATSMLEVSEIGTTWGTYIERYGLAREAELKAQEAIWNDPDRGAMYMKPFYRALYHLKEHGSLKAVKRIRFNGRIPEKRRHAHHHIVAPSGHGKTQILEQMIMADIRNDVPVIVMDSQNKMINRLAERIERERLVLVDPVNCPPAINLFDQMGNPAHIIELYTYIFAALEIELTGRQKTLFDYLVLLMLATPRATLHTMREVLRNGVSDMPDGVSEQTQEFFTGEFHNKQTFGRTREELLARLAALMNNDALMTMISAPETKFDIGTEIIRGKIILISTAKHALTNSGAALFGRIMIARILRAAYLNAIGRQTYFYIDEFRDYADESDIMLNLFEQTRQHKLGLVVAHQYVGQLPTRLRQAVMGGTAIKMVGAVTTEDARLVAGTFGVAPEEISQLPELRFLMNVRGMGTVPYAVEYGRLDKVEKVSNLADIHNDMRAQFAPDFDHKEHFGIKEEVEEEVEVKKVKKVKEVKETVDPDAPQKAGEW